MPVKRKSHGRSKGSKGRGSLVQCASCGATVPKDKAEKVTKKVSLVDRSLEKELRKQGAYISTPVRTKYYCVSCAVHRGIVNVRSEEDRRNVSGRRRRL